MNPTNSDNPDDPLEASSSRKLHTRNRLTADMTKTTLETVCCIILFTYFGALTRMVLNDSFHIFSSELLPNFVNSFFLANIFGSFIMGVFVPLEKLFTPSYVAWYCGVTTGFCGSCTTFSSWQKVTADRFAYGRIADGIMTLLLTFCTSYMALICGKHIGEAIFDRPIRCWRRQRFGEVAVTVTNPDLSTTEVGLRNSFTRYINLLIVTFLTSIAIWIALFLDTSSEVRRKWWVAAAFGPIGSLTRYFYLLHNRKRPTFPLYTFIVNVFASGISTVILVVLVRLPRNMTDDERHAYDLWLNHGVGSGVLGCLSTVSTFVNELHKLADGSIYNAYRYATLSILLSQVLCISIICTNFL